MKRQRKIRLFDGSYFPMKGVRARNVKFYLSFQVRKPPIYLSCKFVKMRKSDRKNFKNRLEARPFAKNSARTLAAVRIMIPYEVQDTHAC